MLGLDICPVPPLGPSRYQEVGWANRICTRLELEWLKTQGSASSVLLLWSLKEAAYKAISPLGYDRAFRPKDLEISFHSAKNPQIQSPLGRLTAKFIPVQQGESHAYATLATFPHLLPRCKIGLSYTDEGPSVAHKSLQIGLNTHFPHLTFALTRSRKGSLDWMNQGKRLGWVSISHEGLWIGWAFVADPEMTLANPPSLDEY